MSTHEQDSLGSKIRPIEIALENFNMRMQGSLSSQLSNLKSKVAYIESRLTPSGGKASTSLPSGADVKGIVEEIKSLIQKDLLKDTTQLINEKLAEFQGLLSRIKTVIAEVSSPQTHLAGLQREAASQPRRGIPTAGLTLALSEKDDEIASLREEINRLYNLTEREPRFQSFWILRDAFPNRLQITKMARILNTTPGEVHESLKTFERLGLVEIEKGEARATKLVRPNKPKTIR